MRLNGLLEFSNPLGRQKDRYAERYSAKHLGLKTAFLGSRDSSRGTARNDGSWGRVAFLAILPLLFLCGSCSSIRNAVSPPSDQPAQFAPVAMRIHPIFTRIEDFNGDNYPDGIDALLEFQDQFGDATKASGRAIFELYPFQKFDAQRKGARLANPWIGSLDSMDDQRLRWNRTSRTYSFPLEFDQVNANATYVLTCQFQRSDGGRFYDQIILEPPQGAYAAKGYPTTSISTTMPSAPTSQPTSQP